MNHHPSDSDPVQPDMFEQEVARSMLDQLLEDSRLYTTSQGYRELLDFVVRLRHFAPFNAMLLQVQKPGISYAASAHDWLVRFKRQPKEGARPLLILWPFGPVALVYDVLDTEGEPLPEDIYAFPATGSITEEKIHILYSLLGKQISCQWLDAGDRKAGYIRLAHIAVDGKDANHYQLFINQNHTPSVQFTTLVHELGHLFLGHLVEDKKLKIPKRRQLNHAQQEIEAESVAYIICKRNGVNPKSQTYLSQFVTDDTAVEDIDLYQVMRAAGQVERLLNLANHTKF
ncbi:MAG: ImmA/IrrE family metallo-endopeptidase [Chromatiaceae bacterium]|nr:ImmA/IrrE family metallo-endopeptidase [Chromatiaceae bacterium]